MTWEVLRALRGVTIRRQGRFLVADLHGPHHVLSTSARNGGLASGVRHLVNHQSCEGTGHDTRFHAIVADGPEAYHDAVCAEIALPPDATATMGTAANMHYAAIVTVEDADVRVTAVVTAGVQSNATCAGDPANWRETATGMERVSAAAPPPSPPPPAAASEPAVAGTINTMLIVDTPLTPAALARTVVTMTEAKTAALQRLAVPSGASRECATGTGTDQYCLAAPMTPLPPEPTRAGGASGAGSRAPAAITSASAHVKFGEIVGVAVRDATIEALRWQNGLEPSYTRGLFHALGRYGVASATIFDDLAATGLLDAADLELLRKNANAAFYEPLAGAAAHALAAVLDRVRHGTLPASAAPDAIVHQAATLAASLAAQPDRWPDFRARLHAFTQTRVQAQAQAQGQTDRAAAPGEPLTRPAGAGAREAGSGSRAAARDASRAVAEARDTPLHDDPKPLVLAAIALGWSEKWRTR